MGPSRPIGSSGTGDLHIGAQKLSIIGELRQAEKHLSRERALALASEALLSNPHDDALDVALQAIVDSTGAGYAYIEDIGPNADGVIWAEVVALVKGESARRLPPDQFWSGGPISDWPAVAGALRVGEPFETFTTALSGKEREAQEKLGIVSELAVAIFHLGQWIGGIGVVNLGGDDWPEGTSSTLMRVADMVAAFWERRRYVENLEQVIESKDRFVAAVSHELRTPLTAVFGLAEILRDEYDGLEDSDRRELISDIARQSRDLTFMVEDLLAFSRGDFGRFRLAASVVDLCEEAQRTFEVLDRFASGERSWSIVGDRKVQAYADPIRVRQILRNLMSNAHRYGGDEVHVTTSRTDKVAIVSVADNGPGVASTMTDAIFEPYVTDSHGPVEPHSIGLGLPVSRGLARAMSGDVRLETRNGWTVFELTLPLFATS